MSAAIDVVIPTWNGRDLLERCLESLAAQTVEHGVIVVDNGSTDGTASWSETASRLSSSSSWIATMGSPAA